MLATARFTIHAFIILSSCKESILMQRKRCVKGYEILYFH